MKFPGAEEIFEPESGYADFLNTISEEKTTYRERRNRFLDHLLARFAESFSDYVQLNYRIIAEGHCPKDKTINAKARFLHEYPTLSRDRFRAFNYCDCARDATWDTDNVSGFKKRISRLLGIEDYSRRSLTPYELDSIKARYGFIVYDSSDDGSLSSLFESKKFYSSRNDAENALERILAYTKNGDHYTHLTYRYFYRYGWEVTDDEGKGIVSYGSYFMHQSKRDAALPSLLNVLAPLLQDLSKDSTLLATTATADSEVNTEAEATQQSQYYTLESDSKGEYYFRLEIPIPDKTPIIFASIQSYGTETAATSAIQKALERIQTRAAYRKRDLPKLAQVGEIEETQMFKDYGYGIIDIEENLLAEATCSWSTGAERNEAIERLQQIPREALLCEIFEQPTGYSGKICSNPPGDNSEKFILLQSVQTHNTKASAWRHGRELLALAQDKNRHHFRLVDSDRGFYGWALMNKAKDQILAESYYTSQDTRNKAIDALQSRIKNEGTDSEGFHPAFLTNIFIDAITLV